ncbi:potassium/proton antiporter [Micropruina sonneratiae]|uniref:potassium/proton antiporter n=1 Tax=Micropruina sonneratiae TaxID=2986940 RepID=UPI00222736AE|nr:potassium/proton antiporter [Micropruina sp. KQZ13P-5]MCW3159541.1 potassium/proton antiporter [Micropruina sp. KQZ13P-5]
MVLLAGAAVLLAALGAARLSSYLGLPSLLLFLFLGVGVGLWVEFDNASLAHDLGFAALVLILAEGGFTTKWREMRSVLSLAGLLATVGICVSIGAMTLFGHFVLGLDLATALLLGAITAPTDSAAVFSVLRRVPIPGRIRAVLEAESGLNDAPVVLLVTAATAWALGESNEGPGEILLMVGVELVGGVILGAAIGWLGAKLLKQIALPASGLYPLGAMGWALLAHGAGASLHVSGFAAVYICAVVLGNSDLPHRNATKSFAEGIGWVAQIGLFVMLGLLAHPERFSSTVVVTGVLAGLFLTLIARPLSVLTTATWFRMPWREQAFLSWAGLRGAVPIIMATVPLASPLPQAKDIFDLVFVFVVVYTTLQAPTLGWAARKLGVTTGDDAVDIEVEVAPLDKIQADFMQIKVPSGSHLHGVTIFELRLPPSTVVSLIIRDGKPFAPGARDVVRSGDELLVVVPSRFRDRVEARFKQVSRGGRLSRWRDNRR